MKLGSLLSVRFRHRSMKSSNIGGHTSLSTALVVTQGTQGLVAGTGRRLGRDVDPTSQLGSLQTSEWYFRVARRRCSEGRRRNEPRPA